MSLQKALWAPGLLWTSLHPCKACQRQFWARWGAGFDSLHGNDSGKSPGYLPFLANVSPKWFFFLWVELCGSCRLGDI